MRAALAEARLPHREIVEGVLILIASAVLLTPGVLTDLAGFSLLVPPIRGTVADLLIKRFQGQLQIAGAVPFGGLEPGRPGPAEPGVVDVEYRVADDD